MTKTYRQAQILKLIDAQPIRTQEELSAALGKIGIDVTQVTLSRDIRELGLIKGHKGYQSTEEAAPPQEAAAALRRAVEEYLREVKTAQNLLILKTVRGTAAPLADALDHNNWPEILGTIAGEDTVFAVTPDAKQSQRAKEKLLGLLR